MGCDYFYGIEYSNKSIINFEHLIDLKIISVLVILKIEAFFRVYLKAIQYKLIFLPILV